MTYNKELSKRFISDYKLPIPLINEEYFFYHLNLYEKDYSSLSKYENLLNLINSNYNNSPNDFLEDYYKVRDNIINAILNNEAFKCFNEMDMSAFSIKNKPSISSNNIYNNDNIGKFFVSIDLKKANFQTLKHIDKNIVLGADTYEDFIEKFTDLEYVKESKYVREVVFGKCDPKRHITVEKYFTTEIYKKVIEKFPHLENKCVSLSNDEIIFNTDFFLFGNSSMCSSFRTAVEKISKEIGFEVRVEFFCLKGYNLILKRNKEVRKTFFIKNYLDTDAKFKLISVPLQYHSLCYKLYKGLELNEIDYHFEYEGLNARFCEEFDVEEIKNN